MKQYEIWWAELPLPVGKRPVLLLSRTPSYVYLANVIVVEVTSRIRSIPQEVALGRSEGLGRACVANFDNVHVVGKERLVKRIGTLAQTRRHEAKRALGYALDWPELKML